MGLDADLAAYYDAEARAGVRGELDTMRLGIRRGFVDLMRREDRRRLVDVGSGPGRDTLAFQQDGFDTIGVDLAPANLVLMRERGAVGSAGSLYALPFADATFDAFSLASHDRWRSMLERHGRLEHLETFAPTQPSGWEYQFAVLRTAG